MICFLSSMPRSGSMWTFNVIREMIRHSSYTLVPEEHPADEQWVEKELIKALDAKDHQQNYYCFRGHFSAEPSLKGIKIVHTYRDVRASLVSFMKFSKASFEKAIPILQTMMALTNFYDHFKNEDNVLMLRYDDMVDQPVPTLERLKVFLELPLDDAVLKQVNQKFSKNEVKKMVTQLDQSDASQPKLQNFDGSLRNFDTHTNFQSNHITETQDNEWQRFLNPQEQQQLMEMTQDWLVKFGFAG